MRVLVCGGRDFTDKDLLFRTLDKLCPTTMGEEANQTWLAPPIDLVIISGGARGADTLAIDWAVVNWCRFSEYKVDVELDGPWPAAGCRRNQRMLESSKPELVLAFPGGRGTADMVRRSRAAGIPVIEIEYDHKPPDHT